MKTRTGGANDSAFGRIGVPFAASGRLGTARVALLAAAAVALGAGGSALAAEDSGTPIQGTHATGYPRSSKEIPPQPAPDGWGSHNPTYETYDTNWIWDAERGDENAIWFMVAGATIYCTAHVSNDDVDDIERLTLSAWGEERIGFAVSDTVEGDVTIHIANDIAMDAAWHLDSKGDHFLYLDAIARDIDGGSHLLKVLRSSSCPTTLQTNTGTMQILAAAGGGSAEAGTDGADAAAGGGTGIEITRTEGSSKTTASGSGDSGTVTYSATIAKSVKGRTCSVAISSIERVTISTRSMEEDHETSLEVPRFDTVNTVSAAYTVVPHQGGTGTPPGDTSGGTGTPGGDTSGGPTTPGGDTSGGPTTPEGDTSGSGPTTSPGTPTPPGDGDAGDDPIGPSGDDAEEPEDFVLPEGDTSLGPTTPGGDSTSLGGSTGDEPGGDSDGGTGGDSGGGTTTGTSSGSLPGGTSGAELLGGSGSSSTGDGTSPLPTGGGTGTGPSTGSGTSTGSDPLAERPSGGGSAGETF